MKTIGKIDITPTWEAAMPVLLIILEDGTAEGKKAARDELMRLARQIDKANEELTKTRNLEQPQ